MREAWALFRSEFDHPRVPFRSIGRHCFVWALKTAWARAKTVHTLAQQDAPDLGAALAQLRTPEHCVGLEPTFSLTPRGALAPAPEIALLERALALAAARDAAGPPPAAPSTRLPR